MPAEPPIRTSPDDELRKLWQDQKLEGERMSIDEIRNKAREFEHGIRRRNMVEYIAAVIVLVAFSVQMYLSPNFVMVLGNFLVLPTTIYVVYTLHRRGSSQRVPDDMGRETFLDFRRTSLERQRNLHRNVWSWYLLPFVPSIILVVIGAAIRDRDQQWNGLNLVGILLFVAGVFVVVAAKNKRTARKLQSQIDALKE